MFLKWCKDIQEDWNVVLNIKQGGSPESFISRIRVRSISYVLPRHRAFSSCSAFFWACVTERSPSSLVVGPGEFVCSDSTFLVSWCKSPGSSEPTTLPMMTQGNKNGESSREDTSWGAGVVNERTETWHVRQVLRNGPRAWLPADGSERRASESTSGCSPARSWIWEHSVRCWGPYTHAEGCSCLKDSIFFPTWWERSPWAATPAAPCRNIPYCGLVYRNATNKYAKVLSLSEVCIQAVYSLPTKTRSTVAFRDESFVGEG